MPAEPEEGPATTLSTIQQELDHLRDALRLLGVKPCIRCGRYFRTQDGKALFEADQSVCYDCIQDWWRQRSPSLDLDQRRLIESRLLRWLLMNHNAKVVDKSDHLPPPGSPELNIVVSCEQCSGTGKALGGNGRCHHCDGRGTVRVIGPPPAAH